VRERERERSESESRRERQRLGSAAVQQRDATSESSRDMRHARANRCESKEMRERAASQILVRYSDKLEYLTLVETPSLSHAC